MTCCNAIAFNSRHVGALLERGDIEAQVFDHVHALGLAHESVQACDFDGVVFGESRRANRDISVDEVGEGQDLELSTYSNSPAKKYALYET